MIGVVKQAVNKSAGNSGIIGNSSFDWQAANWMQFRTGGGTGIGVPCTRQRYEETQRFSPHGNYEDLVLKDTPDFLV